MTRIEELWEQREVVVGKICKFREFWASTLYFSPPNFVDFSCSNPCRQSHFVILQVWATAFDSDHSSRAFALQCVAMTISLVSASSKYDEAYLTPF